MIGAFYGPGLDSRLESGRLGVDCLEVQAEAFYRTTPHRLAWLCARLPIVVRCGSLSLGGDDPLDEGQVSSCAAVVRDANALWVTHPLGFSRSGEIDLGLNVPVPLTPASLNRVRDRILETTERVGCSLLIENSESRLQVRGTLAATDFLNQLCRQSGTRLALNLPALVADSRTHGYDAAAWLRDVDPDLVCQLRVGDVYDRGRPSASSPGPVEQLTMATRVLARAKPQAVVLAADSSTPLDTMVDTLSRLRALVAARQPERAPVT